MASTFTLLKFAILAQISLITFSHAAATGRHLLHADRTLVKRAPGITTTFPAGWVYQGCYTDSVGSRALSAAVFTGQTVTQNTCMNFCNNQGYAYAGVEYSEECFCANIIGASGKVAAAADCGMPCAGNPDQQCGGGNRLNIFHNDNIKVAAKGPSVNNGPPGWGFLGCYTDSVAARTLSLAVGVPGGGANMTVANCAVACQSQGFNISGVEYSGECFCGTQFSNGGAPAPDGLDGCNMVCNGNVTEYCGGPNRLNVYGLGTKSVIEPAWSPLGCYTDQVGSRTLTVGTVVKGGGANMTHENCQNACFAAKYKYAGMEYAEECFCGNAISNGGGPAPDGDTYCNMACKGSPTQICGGPNRLTVFGYTGTFPTTNPQPDPQPNPQPDPNPQPTNLKNAVGLPNGFNYSGCYVDNANGRILSRQLPDSNTQTVEACVAACFAEGYNVVGLQYYAQCFCGKSMINGGKLASSEASCNTPCSGNATEACGGPDRMSIYANKNFTSYGVPKPLATGLPGSWAYQGCLDDTPAVRSLPYQLADNYDMTPESCLSACSRFGYSAAGFELGTQCFCGDDTDRINSGNQYKANAGDCNTACPGNPEALCGGANALQYYTYAGGINVWHQASGNDAGRYQFLIGGKIIPLITAPGRNGKVTFVEKHGTGPPNSTGAWELDLANVDTFDLAWREMGGLKTDVFCSAGLTLPDKAARQLNVGGWSADSLFGIRFYTPNGSPGKAASNGWEESVENVHLQVGRWYPTALQMVNGSILIIGGEDGSNGPPVPNMEVIPKPAGGYLKFAQWLQDTDPNNLYPHAAVLPSGGIFVAYWNRARIIDEKTFDTVKELPNIPGAVNNVEGGRTYPLEGTSMILPQTAPYTEPLGILMCGGSTPFGGHALDNCVTIQPEKPNANWTIERMPSPRVLTCMTALPDGTFLILNGAQKGVAGFGLAEIPNKMALLYDPKKPVNQRFTRLANTTIARMYHSEAILLDDGRVLVTGSDPEGGLDVDGTVFPQELRVEIFIPPYLMGLDNSASAIYPKTAPNITFDGSNAGRPIFTLNNNHTDWAYGESVTFTLASGNVAKISLMGIVSSTHGNSMGQRTIHPAFSCSGRTCTVTAPPNGYITGGPNWFQMFVLNGANIPSMATWVRIGGDPANLGNWPATGGFTLPGV